MDKHAKHSERREAYALLRHAAAPERRQLQAGLAWLLLAAALEAIAPLLSQHYLDHYLLPRRPDLPAMAALLAGVLLLGVSTSLIRFMQLTRLAGVAMRSVRRLREQVYHHVLRLPMAYFDRAITGKLVSRVTNDTEQVKNLYVQVLFVMLDSLIVVCGALAAMAWLDWRLMLVVLLLVPALLIIVWLYQRSSSPAITRSRELRSDINAQVAESIAGMALLQAANAETRFNARFAEINQQHYQARLGELRANSWLLRPMLDLLNVLLLVAVLHQFAGHAIGGASIGVLYAFVGLLGRVVAPLIQITLQFGQLQQAIIAASRVNSLLQEPLPLPGASNQGIGAGAITLERLQFAYDAARPVISDLDLHIPAGQFFGIVGHTGSGKSTLLSLLLRFYTPQSGTILIDGQPLADISNEAFRAGIGLVPQEPFLLATSVSDNIDMGRGLDAAAIETAARAAGCHDFICALEHGYATGLGEGGARLSVGQKQLLAIARALAGKPRILFLDEATSHIDSETEQIVQQALSALRGQVTIIAIAHRLSTIRDADNIVVLNHGRIVEQGCHSALLSRDGGIYQRLYWLQEMDE
ncbi:ABC transporter ATP-binding protein [Chitinimonas sp.]|uniref:ABC transporter ATP-binding protein n=1 Tax=Chitinimonas sp. TaxID=1934313 RepID=UPI0035AEC265